MTTMEKKRRRLLDAALPYIATKGWRKTALADGARHLDWPPEWVDILFPCGINDALDEWQRYIGAHMRTALRDISLPASMRQKIAIVIALRFRILERHRSVMRKAIRYTTRPDRLGLGAKTLFSASDDIWNACGDTARDGDYYSKRTALAAILGCCLTKWATCPYDEKEMAAFIDRRLKDHAALTGWMAPLKRYFSSPPTP